MIDLNPALFLPIFIHLSIHSFIWQIHTEQLSSDRAFRPRPALRSPHSGGRGRRETNTLSCEKKGKMRKQNKTESGTECAWPRTQWMGAGIQWTIRSKGWGRCNQHLIHHMVSEMLAAWFTDGWVDGWVGRWREGPAGLAPWGPSHLAFPFQALIPSQSPLQEPL